MTNKNLTEAQYSSDDEISLREIWQVLVRYKWLVLGMPAIAVVAAIVISTLMKPEWEAIAVIQVGQVGQVGRSAQLIEPVTRAVERIKVRSYGNAVLASLGVPLNNKNPQAHLFRDSLKVKKLPATHLINIKVRGYSREEAKRWAGAIIGRLRKIHAALAAPSIGLLKQQLAEVDRQIKQSQAARKVLLATARFKRRDDPRAFFMEQIVLANTMATRDEELRVLEQTRRLTEEQLSPLHTYPTALVGDVFVGSNPVSPRTALILVLAGTMGVFLGAFLALVVNSLRSQQ